MHTATIKAGRSNKRNVRRSGHRRTKSRTSKSTTSTSQYKCSGVSYSTKKKNIVAFFMEMTNTIKIYHWNTHSFAQHKATDELYSSLNSNMDLFVETLLGKKQDRISSVEKHVNIAILRNKRELVDTINKYITYLEKLDVCFSGKETDLLNIRDEIMGDLNKFKYLLTLK